MTLQNDRLRAVIVPELGGRVWELEDRRRGRQWLWHREDVPLAWAPPGASYDDVWAGGWEELFPNDAAGTFEGRRLPDHGEWWTLGWTVADAAGGERGVVRLTATSTIVGALCEKEFRLEAGQATLEVRYRIRSTEAQPFHFLFKQHLPIRLTPGCRLQVPGGRVEPVDVSFGTWLNEPAPFDWPVATTKAAVTDLRVVPPRAAAAREFVYISNLPEAWCAVEDPVAGASLRMDFDRQAFPYLWLFLSYGGWRNTYTAVLEPCTNMPKDLADAVRAGQSARLMPGEEFATTVSVSLQGTEGGR